MSAVYYVLGFLLVWSSSGPWGVAEYALLRTEGGPGATWSTIVTTIDTTYIDRNIEPGKRYFYAARTRHVDSLTWSAPGDTSSAALVEASQGLEPRRIYSYRGEKDGLELLELYVPEAGPWRFSWDPAIPELEILETVVVWCEWDFNKDGRINLSDLSVFSSKPRTQLEREQFAKIYSKAGRLIVPITGRLQ